MGARAAPPLWTFPGSCRILPLTASQTAGAPGALGPALWADWAAALPLAWPWTRGPARPAELCEPRAGCWLRSRPASASAPAPLCTEVAAAARADGLPGSCVCGGRGAIGTPARGAWGRERQRRLLGERGDLGGRGLGSRGPQVWGEAPGQGCGPEGMRGPGGRVRAASWHPGRVALGVSPSRAAGPEGGPVGRLQGAVPSGPCASRDRPPSSAGRGRLCRAAGQGTRAGGKPAVCQSRRARGQGGWGGACRARSLQPQQPPGTSHEVVRSWGPAPGQDAGGGPRPTLPGCPTAQSAGPRAPRDPGRGRGRWGNMGRRWPRKALTGTERPAGSPGPSRSQCWRVGPGAVCRALPQHSARGLRGLARQQGEPSPRQTGGGLRGCGRPGAA